MERVAVITGGASGIGRALSEEIAKQDTMAIVADIDLLGAERVAAEIQAAGGRALAKKLDVANSESIQSVVDEVIRDQGRLDYMFNIAGIAVVGDFRDISLEDIKNIIDVNLLGTISGAKIAYAQMANQGFGHIVNMSSVLGFVSVPFYLPYVITKNAVVSFSAALRAEAEGCGVKVSVICPGYVDTNIFEATRYVNMDKEAVIAQRIPVKLMNPKRAAQLILRGVEKNKAMIVFPFYAKFFQLLSRIHPQLVSPIVKRSVRTFRALRRPSIEG